MNLIRNFITTLMLGLALNSYAGLSDVPTGEYALDKTHGYITFTYSHMGFSTPHVAFKSFDVQLNLDSAHPGNSAVSVTIDAASVDSRVALLDEHLRGEKFFDAAKYPDIRFRSTAVESLGNDEFKVTGDLTIKDVTAPVVLKTTIKKAANNPMSGKPTVGAVAETTLSRSAWGISEYVPNVGDEVTVYISVELQKKD